MDDVVKHPPGRDMIPQGTQENGVPFGHEKSDANARMTLIAMVVVLSSAAVAMLAMAGMFKYLNNREMAKDAAVPAMIREARQYPPGPVLLPGKVDQRLPWEVHADERVADEKTASKLGLMNSQTGMYQIPANAGAGASDTKTYSAGERYKWEDPDRRYSVDSSGGLSLEPTQGAEQAQSAEPAQGAEPTNGAEPANGAQ